MPIPGSQSVFVIHTHTSKRPSGDFSGVRTPFLCARVWACACVCVFWWVGRGLGRTWGSCEFGRAYFLRLDELAQLVDELHAAKVFPDLGAAEEADQVFVAETIVGIVIATLMFCIDIHTNHKLWLVATSTPPRSDLFALILSSSCTPFHPLWTLPAC